MKTLTVGLMAMMMAVMVTGAWAGEGCCAKATAAPKECTMSDCKDMVSGLDLSADQQAKVDALTAKCGAMGCAKTAMGEWQSGMAEILTEDQVAQLQKTCADKNMACPMMKKKGCSAAN